MFANLDILSPPPPPEMSREALKAKFDAEVLRPLRVQALAAASRSGGTTAEVLERAEEYMLYLLKRRSE